MRSFATPIGGLVAEAAGIRAAYLIMAVGVALSAAVGWFSPLCESDVAPVELAV